MTCFCGSKMKMTGQLKDLTALMRCINDDASETSRFMAYAVPVIPADFFRILPSLA